MSPVYRRRRQPRVRLDRGPAFHDAAREEARRGDGKFGEQPRDEVALDLMPPEPGVGGGPSTAQPDPRDGLSAHTVAASVAALVATQADEPPGVLEADRATALVLTAEWEPPIHPSRVPPWDRDAAAMAYAAWEADPPDPVEFRDAARAGEMPDESYELNAAEADRARRMVLALAADAHRNLRWAHRLDDQDACDYWATARARYCAHFGRLYWGAPAAADLEDGHPAADLAERMDAALAGWFIEHGPGGSLVGKGDVIPVGVRTGADEAAYREFVRQAWDAHAAAEAATF